MNRTIRVGAVDEAPYSRDCAKDYPNITEDCHVGSELGIMLQILESLNFTPVVKMKDEWEGMVEAVQAGGADIVGLTDSDIAWSDYHSVEAVAFVYHDTSQLQVDDISAHKSIFPKLHTDFFWGFIVSLALCLCAQSLIRELLQREPSRVLFFGFFIVLELISELFGAATVQNLNLVRPHKPLFEDLIGLSQLLIAKHKRLVIQGSPDSLTDIIRGNGGHDDPIERIVYPKDARYANESWARQLRRASNVNPPATVDGLGQMVDRLLGGDLIGLVYENDLGPIMRLGCEFHVIKLPSLPVSSFYHVYRKGLPFEDVREICTTPLLMELTHQRAQKIFTKLPWSLCLRRTQAHNREPAPIKAAQYSRVVRLPLQLEALSLLLFLAELCTAAAAALYRSRIVRETTSSC